MPFPLPGPASGFAHRIAYVEDHERLARLVQRGLQQQGIQVDVYANSETAWAALSQHAYAAAIIDRGLPDGDGMQLVKRLRESDNPLPCMLLTARDALSDRVDGLEAGADDYLAKPFALEELVARTRALMRRPPSFHSTQVSHGDLLLEPAQLCMQSAGNSTVLAQAEMQIMLCLMRAGGQIVRRSALESAAWGAGNSVTPNALDVAIHRLRRKLASLGSTMTVLNLRGQGFTLRA